MTTTYVGELTLGAALPLPVVTVAAAQAQVSAQLSAMISASLQLGLPSTLADLLALANSLEQMLALGLQPPTVGVQIAAFASVIAQLEAQLIPFSLFASLMASGGVFVYAYDGATSGVGSDLTTALASGFPGHAAIDHANMLVLGTVASATWTAMSSVFKVSP